MSVTVCPILSIISRPATLLLTESVLVEPPSTSSSGLRQPPCPPVTPVAPNFLHTLSTSTSATQMDSFRSSIIPHIASPLMTRASFKIVQGCRQYSTKRYRFIKSESTHRRVVSDGKYRNDQTEHTNKVPELTHLTPTGAAHMVDISSKSVTKRTATASAVLIFSSDKTYKALKSSTLKKGDALAVARIAAIQAAKKTSDLIPLAHPGLGLTSVEVDLDLYPPDHLQGPDEKAILAESDTRHHPPPYDMRYFHGGVRILTTVTCCDKTGIEMEALVAANIGALTMFDMLKGIDKNMIIECVRVVSKKGGKSGDWKLDFEKRKLEQSDIPPDEYDLADMQHDSELELHHPEAETGVVIEPDSELRRHDAEETGVQTPEETDVSASTHGVPDTTIVKSADRPPTEQELLQDMGQKRLLPTTKETLTRAQSLYLAGISRREQLLDFKKMSLLEGRLLQSQHKVQLLRELLTVERQKVQNEKERNELSRINIQEEIDREVQSSREDQEGGETSRAVVDNVCHQPVLESKISSQDLFNKKFERFEAWKDSR